jgi:hypothetical protein
VRGVSVSRLAWLMTKERERERTTSPHPLMTRGLQSLIAASSASSIIIIIQIPWFIRGWTRRRDRARQRART